MTHTVSIGIKNKKINSNEEFIYGYTSYMQLNKELINKFGEKTHKKWHMRIGDNKRLTYDENMDIEKYIPLIFESDEFKEDGWSNIALGEYRLTKKEENNDAIFKKWLQDSIDHVQVYFSSSLRLEANLTCIDFNISGEKESNIFFWLAKRLFEVFTTDIEFFTATKTSGNTDLYCIFPDRREISWMQLIEAELLKEDIPSAYDIWYIPNIGSVVISTQEIFDNDNKQHRYTAHAIEKELHKIGLLPLIKDSSDLGFIGREEWRKNMGLTD